MARSRALSGEIVATQSLLGSNDSDMSAPQCCRSQRQEWPLDADVDDGRRCDEQTACHNDEGDAFRLEMVSGSQNEQVE